MTSKARILLPTFGSLGDIHPFLALALELQARGHQPVLATSELYRSKIEDAGILFHSIAPQLPPREEWNEYIPRLMDGHHGTRRLFRELLMPSLRQSYTDLLPVARECDVIVTHSIIYAAPLCAEILGKKWLSVVLAPLALWSVYDPPFISGLPAPERLRPQLRLQRAIKGIARKVSRRWVREVPRFRAQMGLPPGRHPLFEGAHSPYGTLALFSPELAVPQPDWPAPTFQTGYCFYDRKGVLFGDEAYAGALSPTIEKFLQRGEPPVVFTLGSAAVFDARNFYVAAVEAMRLLKRRAILLIGDDSNRPANLPRNDERIAAFEYAPYSELFPHAAAVVHQGGAGTTGQVLRAGVPSLVMPYSHDQPDHAWRLQQRGIARTLARNHCNTSALAAALGDLLSIPQYGERARAIGERVRQENGGVRAADIIEQILDQPENPKH